MSIGQSVKSKSLAFENVVLLSLIPSGPKLKRSFMPNVSDGAVPDAMLSMQVMRHDPHKPLEAIAAYIYMRA